MAKSKLENMKHTEEYLSVKYWENYLKQLEKFREENLSENVVEFREQLFTSHKDMTTFDQDKLDAEIYRVRLILSVLRHPVDIDEV